jgi:uncharacterized protein HemX
MPRPRIRFRRRAADPPAQPGTPTAGGAKARPESQRATAPSEAPTQRAPVPAQPRPDPQERIDGLRAWLAELDRKLRVRTYVGVAIAVLALAAAAVGLVLTLQLRQDSATKDDVTSLRDQLSGVQQSATQAAQSSVRSLDQRLADLEGQVTRISTDERTTKRELEVVQGDIKELRSQISSAGGQPGTGSGKSGP